MTNFVAFFSTVSAIFAFLTIIWNRKDWVNFTIKLIFFAMTLWSLFNLGQVLGFVVKT